MAVCLDIPYPTSHIPKANIFTCWWISPQADSISANLGERRLRCICQESNYILRSRQVFFQAAYLLTYTRHRNRMCARKWILPSSSENKSDFRIDIHSWKPRTSLDLQKPALPSEPRIKDGDCCQASVGARLASYCFCKPTCRYRTQIINSWKREVKSNLYGDRFAAYLFTWGFTGLFRKFQNFWRSIDSLLAAKTFQKILEGLLFFYCRSFWRCY